MHLLDLFGKEESGRVASSDHFTNFLLKNVVDDSRLVKEGDVLVLDVRELTHVKTPVHDMMQQALELGACCIITNAKEEDLKAHHLPLDSFIFTDNPALCLMRYGQQMYPDVPAFVVGVTGTNGKTSVASFFAQICALCGRQSASVGTLGVHVWGQDIQPTGFTTPKAIQMHQILHQLHAAGVTHVCLEVSSHALVLNRTDGVPLAAAAFTNITPDHTDFHGDMENYFLAKSRLFSEVLSQNSTAVLNMSNPLMWSVGAMCKGRDIPVLSAGPSQAEIVVRALEFKQNGMQVEVKYKHFHEVFFIPLIGAFQCENLAMAIGLCLSTGIEFEEMKDVFPHIKGVAGRMENVAGEGCPFSLVVDYAHTPDALEKAILSVKSQVQGRLIVLFGCGGNRDATKRPLMGAVAHKLADVVMITDDNPRYENAEEIRSQIAKGAPNALNCGDRKEAIFQVVNMAKEGDVVLLAGKGHESGQIIGDETKPFDDRQVALEALNALSERYVS